MYYIYMFIIQTTESIDVYSFGHLLYEMTYGRPPDAVPVDQYPSVPYTSVGQLGKKSVYSLYLFNFF